MYFVLDYTSFELFAAFVLFEIVGKIGKDEERLRLEMITTHIIVMQTLNLQCISGAIEQI